jgi:eukaryotic-like serine/threonine-protein kinase
VRPATNNDRDQPTLEPLARGTTIGRFVILGLVGRGGMGEVYAAHDPELDRKVAIKLLRAGSDGSRQGNDARARLIREAQAIAKVSHPNVVVVYDVGTFDGRVFIAMEFVEGHTLGYWLLAGSRTTSQILEAFGAAGRGLAAAHERELVHRDFKPDNAMVATNGRVRVMDFGLARFAIDADKPYGRETPRGASLVAAAEGGDADPMSTRILDDVTPMRTVAPATNSTSPAWNLTIEGAILGTPAYMSPEQF